MDHVALISLFLTWSFPTTIAIVNYISACSYGATWGMANNPIYRWTKSE